MANFSKLQIAIVVGFSLAAFGHDSGPQPTAECSSVDSNAADFAAAAAACQEEAKTIGWAPVCGNG